MNKIAHIGAAAGAAMLLAGCASTNPAMQRANDTTLASGWRVDCTDDQALAQRTCYAGTFGETSETLKFFQIAFVNKTGPLLRTPHDFPGRTPSVRVGDGPVLTDPAKIVEALKAGGTAYVAFDVWPYGGQRMIVKVDGFAEAYQLLLQRVAS